MRPVKPGAGQQPDRAPAQLGMHPVAVEFDFMEPVWPVGRLVDQLGELRFDPAGERRCLGAPPVVERLRHVPGTKRAPPRIDPARIYPFTCRMIFVHRSTIGSTVSAFSGGNIGTTRATPISAKRFIRSGSSPRPNKVISMEARSRPASRTISRNFGRASAISPRAAVGIQPSP